MEIQRRDNWKNDWKERRKETGVCLLGVDKKLDRKKQSLEGEKVEWWTRSGKKQESKSKKSKD